MDDPNRPGEQPTRLGRAPTNPVPDRIGAYVIHSLLGEGGFGLVYLAEQETPVRRRVAVKVVKRGMESRQVLARFAAEQQAMASIDHPHIAKVFDAGETADGRAYFVMEYVPGESITAYCDRHRLPPQERLRLFIQVCEAVHHCHQHGIVHRDIKPTNILVVPGDPVPMPKIIDFGVAKALDRPLVERTFFTELGQVIGTPEYMSPEQAEMSVLDVDTRADVYSLGVVLYELMVGALPFDPSELRERGLMEIQRVIREVDPPKPSTRLSSLGEDSTAIAQARRSDRKALERTLRGDLDWITMRAMEKDRARRYASASEFALDIRRYLEDEPVLAGPPGLAYRLRKLARKYRVQTTAAGVVLGVVVAANAVGFGLYFRERAAERRARLAGEAARVSAVAAREAAEAYADGAYIANILGADSHLRLDEAGRAVERLDACPRDRRGLEWGLLRYAVGEGVQTLATGDSPIDIVFEDGANRLLAATVAGMEGWSLRTGERTMFREIRNRYTDGSAVAYPLAIAGNGTMVLAAHPRADGAVALVVHEWPSLVEKAQVAMADSRDGLRAAFDRGGTRVAVRTSAGGPVRLVAVDGATAAVELPGAAFFVFTSDGTRLFCAGEGLAAFGAASAEPVAARPIPGIRGLALDEDGSRLLVLTEHQALILDATNLEEITRLPAGGDRACWHGPGRIAIAAGSSVRVFDLAMGEEVARLRGHRDRVLAVAGREDVLATGGGDRAVRLWDPSRHTRPLGAGPVAAIAGGGERLALARAPRDGERLLEVAAEPTLMPRFERALPGLQRLAFDEQGGRIAAARGDGVIEILDAATGRAISSISLGLTPMFVEGLRFSPDGARLACLSRGLAGGPVVYLIDVAGPSLVGTLGDPGAHYSAIEVTDDRLLVAGDSGVVAYDRALERAWAWPSDVAATSIAASPGGVAVGLGDGRLVVLGAEGEGRAAGRVSPGPIWGVAWCEGRILAASGRTVSIVRAADARPLLSIDAGRDVQEVIPRGRRGFIALGRDGAAAVWRAAGDW